MERNDGGISFTVEQNLQSKYVLLNLPRVHNRHVKRNMLSPENKFLHLFVCEMILPRLDVRDTMKSQRNDENLVIRVNGMKEHRQWQEEVEGANMMEFFHMW